MTCKSFSDNISDNRFGEYVREFGIEGNVTLSFWGQVAASKTSSYGRYRITVSLDISERSQEDFSFDTHDEDMFLALRGDESRENMRADAERNAVYEALKQNRERIMEIIAEIEEENQSA